MRNMSDRSKREQRKASADLRTMAEKQLTSALPDKLAQTSTEELLHELQVHQIELEMQNEALRHAQIELEESRDRYAELYEFAPVGYLALTAEGRISEINLTATNLLGRERTRCVGQPFMHFIAPTDRGNWQNLFSVFQQATTHQRFDLTLLRRDGSKLDARFLGVIRVSSVSDAFIWLMFVDISERRATEEHLSKLSLAVEQCHFQKTTAPISAV